MVLTRVESELPISLDRLFNYVSNLETMVEYNSSVKKAVWKENTRSSKICSITIVLSFLNFSGDYIVTEIIQNQKIVARCNTGTLDFEDTYYFSGDDSKSKIIIEDRMNLKGLLSLSEGILKPIMKTEMEANLKTLITKLG